VEERRFSAAIQNARMQGFSPLGQREAAEVTASRFFCN